MVLWCSQTFAQISAYNGIVYPYDSEHTQTLGGIINAVPNHFSGIQSNPAGLTFFKNPKLSLSMHYNRSNDILKNDWEDKNINFSTSDIYPGAISGSIPVKILNKNIVFALSYNKIEKPVFEIWDALNEVEQVQADHSRKGNVGNVNIGFGTNFNKNFSIGFGITKWIGNWEWTDEISTDISGNGKFQYSGSNFTLGTLHHFNKISIGVTIHSPFTLMKSNNIFITTWYGDETYDINQYFKGAAKLGIVYNLNPQFILGIGYYFQNNFVMKIKSDNSELEEVKNNYGKSHQISIGSEFTFIFDEFQLPVFLTYQPTWTPEIKNDIHFPPVFYQYFNSLNKEKLSHSIVVGFGLNTQSYVLNFSSQWTTKLTKVVNELTSPFT